VLVLKFHIALHASNIHFKTSAQKQPSHCYQNFVMSQSSVHKIKNSPQIFNFFPMLYTHFTSHHLTFTSYCSTLHPSYIFLKKEERALPGYLHNRQFCSNYPLINVLSLVTPLFIFWSGTSSG
jgi:hypothetical protein